MHILFLTDNFPPEVNAPASRTFEHCSQWARAGHQVTVITGAPNFPSGRLLGGYRNRIYQSETMEGVRVIRVWTYITSNEGFAKRVLDYLSFMVSASLAALFVRKPDVIVGTSPQFFTACAAWFVGTIRRKPWVFELRDLWPESIKAVGAMGETRAYRLLEKIEMLLYRQADMIVTVTHTFKQKLTARDIDPAKIHVVTNGADLGRYRPQSKDGALLRELGLEHKFVAGYIGTHGMAHALGTLLDAAEGLRGIAGGQDVAIILLGDGAEKPALKAAATQRGLSNVVFLDSVPKNEVVRYWSILDVAIIHLRRSELFTTVIPSKMFECMAMGVPILHGVSGESAEIVQREEVGLLFEPENAEALKDGLLRLKNDPALRDKLRADGPAAALHYDRSMLAKDMLELLAKVAEAQ